MCVKVNPLQDFASLYAVLCHNSFNSIQGTSLAGWASNLAGWAGNLAGQAGQAGITTHSLAGLGRPVAQAEPADASSFHSDLSLICDNLIK